MNTAGGQGAERSDFCGETVALIRELYPICRSITGNGVRETLRILQKHIPVTIHEVPSGTRVFDWTVPKEWNIRDAYVKNARGEKVIDFARSNLHVVSYSVPFIGKVTLDELKQHLFSLHDYPDWIPYRTTYYNEAWGFCVSHKQLLELQNEEYEVYIDSSLDDGHLTYGEYFLRGETADEILISTHTCHPSLCNDNLSGIALVTALAKSVSGRARRYSYRFLFTPGTIGSITWLAQNEERVPLIKHGFVVAGVGDRGTLHYKKSRRGGAEIDRAFAHVLKHAPDGGQLLDFSPYGYDERQFCSPGFNLPVGRVSRTPHGQYPEYHTSADNLDFISADALRDSFQKCAAVLDVLESNRTYLNQNPKCEPQLGRRGLYSAVGAQTDRKAQEMAILWILNLSDGSRSVLDIAEISGYECAVIKSIANLLVKHELLKEVPQ
jgi:aminopeptidase-like protein